MLFEIILTSVVLVAGLLILADKLWLAARRASEVKLPVALDYAYSLFPVLAVVLVLRSFVVEPFRIPSGSMYPTLHIGDFILVNKMSYGVRLPVIYTKLVETGTPERGDVVVFRFPEDPEKDYIKRVIGLPGDKISYVAKSVMVNGRSLTQTPVGRYETSGSGAVMNGALELTETQTDTIQHNILIDKDRNSTDLLDIEVPEGHYFVMGDNRDHSYDSRFWGFVPEENLKGRAFFVWMHFDDGVNTDRIGSSIK
jgi:signal peptidase I